MTAPNCYALPSDTPPRRGKGLPATDVAALIALLSPVLMFAIGDAVAHLPALSGVFDGRDVMSRTGIVGPPNYIRNAAELASFAATTLLLLTAGGALLFTTSQIAEARDARIAAIYIEINNKYTSPDLVEARKAVRRLRDEHKEAGGAESEFGLFIKARFNEWETRPTDSPDYLKVISCMRLMAFWEDTGVLVRRTLVDIEVVLDFHAGAVKYAGRVFGPYVAERRASLQSGTLYANALWLMDQAQRFQPYRFP